MQLIDKCVAAVEAAGGRLVLDPAVPEHKELIEGITLVVRTTLVRQHQIVVKVDQTSRQPVEMYKTSAADPNAKPVVPKPAPKAQPVVAPTETKSGASHTFVKPPFFDEVVAMLSAGANWTTEKASNLLFVGPKGSGKTETVELVAQACGFARVYQINGYAEMPASSFLGTKTVAVDQKSMQSYVTHAKGILERAMVHGLELDANGNTVLDEDGNVKIVGAPAMLFIDEFAGLSEQVAFVLNRAMQVPREPGKSRVIEIDTDGGRMVKSHPGFCVILAGNVIGRGFASEAEQGYTAQSTAQDMSFLDRITATFTFGYNLVAERQIVMEKLQDDTTAAQVLQFRNAVREAYCRRTVETLLSTRGLIALCDAIRVMRRAGFKGSDSVGRAIYRTLFCGLVDTEKKAWNEAVLLAFGVDIAKLYGNSDKLWVPEFK